MTLALAVLSGFLLALVVPWLPGLERRGWGWAMAVLPAALAGWFTTFVPDVLAGTVVRESHTWVEELGIRFAFRLDGWGMIFALLVTGIGALVMVYSGAYMEGRAKNGRFYAFLLAFMASMLGVVLADDAITLYVFWELTSLTSFILIGYEHERAAARQAALQALLVTTGSGLAMLAGLVMVGLLAGDFGLSQWEAQAATIRGDAWYTPAVVLILIGALGKSAQFPLHFWLPNAMEAPTPVSAYLHSSTMVKAGVYLAGRLLPVLGGTMLWASILVIAGATTWLVAGWWAVRATELKRLLAYATASTLGLLVLLIGLGTEQAIGAAMVVLVAHAAYKGALFMLAGAITHGTDQRDIRRLGGLVRRMPATGGLGLVALAGMAGVPPLVNFVAKEAVFTAVWRQPWVWPMLSAVALVGGALGVAAAVRVAWRAFLRPARDAAGAAGKIAVEELAGPAVLVLASVVVGLWPGFLDGLLSSAAAAVRGQPVELHLALWHGPSAALLLDALALASGVAIVIALGPVVRRMAPAERVFRMHPEQGYELALGGVNRLAAWQTHVLQSGKLPRYLRTILGSVALLVLAALALRGGLAWDGVLVGFGVIESALCGLVLAAAICVVRSDSRLAAITALGVVGAGVALVFALGGAPDLAMTQLVVEALTVILFVLVFYHLPRYGPEVGRAQRLRDLGVAGAAGTAVALVVLSASAAPLDRYIAREYLQRSFSEAHGRNVVNTILVDFRALDTLGEITVLAVAAAGVFTLLRLRIGQRRDWREQSDCGTAAGPGRALASLTAAAGGPTTTSGSTILHALARFLVPVLLVVSLVMFYRGHNEPGGGFVAGLIAVVALALDMLAHGPASTRRLLRVQPPTLVGLGLLVAGGSGLASWLAGKPFLSGLWVGGTSGASAGVAVGTPLVFDAGVYLVVVGMAMWIILSLAED